jgi:hypothetical protein
VGYFAKEEAGALAYARALERLKTQEGALPARAMDRYSLDRDARAPAAAPAAAAGPLPGAPHAAAPGPAPRV